MMEQKSQNGALDMEQKSQNGALGMEQKSQNGPLGMEQKSQNGPLDIARSTRDVPPAHYILKIESFSQLEQVLSDTGRENYESDIFEAFGYKWKLSLYPNGHKEKNGEGYISLYLVIAETESLPVGWDIKVNLKLFVFDHVHETYSIFQGTIRLLPPSQNVFPNLLLIKSKFGHLFWDGDTNGEIRNFYESKTESGFAKLLPLTVFKDPTNGFLSRDKCVFGVELFVLNYSGKGECLTWVQKVQAVHTWKIYNFSSLKKFYYYHSDVFTLGKHTWNVRIYPKGEIRAKGEAISLFLILNNNQNRGDACANFKLRVKDQLNGKHTERSAKYWFSKSKSGWGWNKYWFSKPGRGWPRFLTMSDLYNASKGFLVNDTLIVEVDEIVSIPSVKKFPQVSSC